MGGPTERLPDVGAFIRDRRRAMSLSLRKLSELAGVSNPYLSQIERGVRKPSAEILNALSHALQVSAETLYVQAGFLDEPDERPRVEDAIALDDTIGDNHRRMLVDLYRTFQREHAARAGADRESDESDDDGNVTVTGNG